MNSTFLPLLQRLRPICLSVILLFYAHLVIGQCVSNQITAPRDTIYTCLSIGSGTTTFNNDIGALQDYAYVITDENDLILFQVFNGVLDPYTLSPGEYHVYGVSYLGTLSLPTSQPISSIFTSICHQLSSNFITIFVDNIPTLADAGMDQEVCNSFSNMLSGNTPINGTGLWESLAGPVKPAILDPFSPNTTAFGFIPGVYTFEYAISTLGCSQDTISRDTVTINNYALASADAGADQSLCSVFLTNLEGNTPSSGSGEWAQLSGGTVVIDDITNPNTGISGLTTGDYEFEWTITNGACMDKDTVNVIVGLAASPAMAGVDTELCETSELSLAGNVPAFGNGMWSILSGPLNAVITDPTSNVSSVTNLEVGTYEFIWTITNGNCESLDTVQYTVLEQPNLSATTSGVTTVGGTDGTIEVCLLSGATPFTVTYSSMEGILSNVILPGCLGGYLISGLSSGFYDVYVADANMCTDTIFDLLVEAFDCNNFAVNNVSSFNSSCFGSDDGGITIVSTGGSPNYTYSIGNGIPDATSNNAIYAFQNLPVGTYSVAVTDGSGCVATYATPVVISEPPQLEISATTVQESASGASDGAINVCVNGGTSPYSLELTPTAGVLISLGGVSCDENFQYVNLPPDVYELIVEDASGCRDTLVNVVVGSPSCSIVTNQVFVNSEPTCFW